MTAPILDPDDPEDVTTAAECVLNGGVVVAPSDTNLALTIDPWNEAAIERAFRIKEREPTDPLTLFVREPTAWREWATHPEPALVDELVEAFWPGPLNLILERSDAVPDRVVAGGETVGIGSLANPTWRALSAAVDRPLAMTSANVTGQADGRLVDTDLAVEQVGDRVDYVLPGEAQGTTASSTILDLTGEPRILRRGDLSAAELERAADCQIRQSP